MMAGAAAVLLTAGFAAPAMANDVQETIEVCRHYSWTGGPLGADGAPLTRAPGPEWQANSPQEPHDNGGDPATWPGENPGLHYTGDPGQANWFDYACVDEPPQPCPVETVFVPGPTVTATEKVEVPGPTVTATVTQSGEPVPGPTVTVTETATATATATVTATATETALIPGPTISIPGPTVTATQNVPGPTATVTFCPVTGTVTQGPPLAATGASGTLWTTIAGLLALAAGGYLAFAASRRKGAHE